MNVPGNPNGWSTDKSGYEVRMANAERDIVELQKSVRSIEKFHWKLVGALGAAALVGSNLIDFVRWIAGK